MAGIYIHIPFCKQACNYCNFYFSTSTYFQEDFVQALLQEIENQQAYLEDQSVESIYFGGGTPSILTEKQLDMILNKIKQTFKLNSSLELTLEANPDDLSAEKLRKLKNLEVNRLSIGTQSFHQADLEFMRRAHNAEEAIQSITLAKEMGFENLSIDLIYGTPTQSHSSWLENLKMTEQLGINHLSCYALTVEEGTALFQQIKKGQVNNIDEELAALHFNQLQEWAKRNNWQHYEISNLCADDNYAVHNTSYWQGKPYLGLGPAAHSYNGKSRKWNIANLKKYIEGINSNEANSSQELLSESDLYNEYVMTRIRTQWGIDKALLKKDFPDFYSNFEKHLEHINPSWIMDAQNKLVLSEEGMFYADGIASKLFADDLN